jgi:putative hydrolase of the HAD superfamily
MTFPLDLTKRHRASLRWIAFDVVGTLMHPEPSAADVYLAVAGRHGSRRSRDEIARRFGMAFEKSEQADLRASGRARLATSEAHERARWRAIVADVIDDVPDVDGCFEELFEHFSRSSAWRCFPEVPEVLSKLVNRGYQLALATNFDARLHKVCAEIPAIEQIRVRVISSEVGYRKPGKPFFDALLKSTGARPGDVLMVGDDRENDILGAQAAGIDAVMINRRAPQAEGELADLRELLPMLEAT